MTRQHKQALEFARYLFEHNVPIRADKMHIIIGAECWTQFEFHIG